MRLRPSTVFKVHVASILLLLCANVLAIVSKMHPGQGPLYNLAPWFDFNIENSIPTFFSAIMLLVCCILLGIIAVRTKRQKKKRPSYIPWFGLSLIFSFLAIDEKTSLHERLTVPMRETFEATGFLHYAWVIPYGFALLVFILAYTKFLLDLPKNTAILFLVSGLIFTIGALGLEMLGGNHAESFGESDLFYYTLYTYEELFEMLGIAVFTYTLLRYMTQAAPVQSRKFLNRL